MLVTRHLVTFLVAIVTAGRVQASVLRHSKIHRTHKRDPTQAIPDALVRAFRSATWIWTLESETPIAPPGDRAFRKTFTSPPGKYATSATVLLTVDDIFTLYVNGAPIGAPPSSAHIWTVAQKFSVALNDSYNVFAVLGTNLLRASGIDSAAGLLAAIQVNFTDGSDAIFTSDNTWKALHTVPNNFQLADFNDSNWDAAVPVGTYGEFPWEDHVAVTQSSSPALSLNNSVWIWSAEVKPPIAPAEPRIFRKTHLTPPGKIARSATILLTVDNGFTLFINGALIGSSPQSIDIWKFAQRFTVPLQPNSNLFAVLATNLLRPDTSGGLTPAGLIAAIQIFYTDGTNETVPSDTTWRVNKDIAVGSEQPGVDDQTWPNATALGQFGVRPWGSGIGIADSLALSLFATSVPAQSQLPSSTASILSTSSGGTSPTSTLCTSIPTVTPNIIHTHTSPIGKASAQSINGVLIVFALTFAFTLL